MKLLKDLINISETTKEDMSKLPLDVYNDLKRNIRKGAEDLQQRYANALELVHKSYSVEGVQRPSPSMKSAWTQYEELLTYAVQQLAKNRGMDADWRMSSSMFREATQQKQPISVVIETPTDKQSIQVMADDIEQLLENIKPNGFDISVCENDTHTIVNFSRLNIFNKTKVLIKKQ